MKILLFGKYGQVGWELNRSLLPLGKVVAMGREDADFSKPESLREIVKRIKPDVIVNAAAYTAVDRAEEEEELAIVVNATSPGVLGEEARNANALLVHYSTDYVFDGTKTGSYTEVDATNPVNAYGRSKLAGEKAIIQSGCDYLILRTSWVYSSRSSNFLLTIMRILREKNEINVINDQYGAPTFSRYIADATTCCVRQCQNWRRSGIFESGTYNLTAGGKTTWHGFAEKILLETSRVAPGHAGFKCTKINPVSSGEYKTAALRPMNSSMDVKRIQEKFFVRIPEWQESLELCMEELSDSLIQ